MFLPENWPSYYSRAEGCHLWDMDGKRYIDLSIMGIGTNILGYGNREIDSAIKWAKGLGLDTSTELIFGMPHDTRDNFVSLLDRSINRGFDNVLVHNLLFMDGIEMNRKAYREKYNYKTKSCNNIRPCWF